MDLTDQQWITIRHLFPSPSGGRGRPALAPRRILDGILWKIRTNAPWRDIPADYPSHQTCYRLYCTWKASDLLRTVIFFLYSDLIYRGHFTPYQAVAEKQITLQVMDRSFHFFVAPRYKDDWRTNTALLFLQIELDNVVRRIIATSKTGRVQRRQITSLTFQFDRWPKFAPLALSGPNPETYAGPENITFPLG